MKIIISILLCSGVIAHASPAAQYIGTCDYYPVLSRALGCGSNGYLIQFGELYCQKFRDEEPFFSPQGQAVLDQIRLCLQTSLEQVHDLTCTNMENIAAQTHVSCYSLSGFCKLNPFEKAALATTISPALLDPVFSRSVLKIEQHCLIEAAGAD